MMRTVLNSKLHRVRVTEANIEYMGSISIDSEILDYSGIMPHEKVLVVDLNNGQRLETYVIPAAEGSKEICLNGAAARLVEAGDEIIVMSFALIEDDKIKDWQPKVVFFDEENNIIEK